MSTKERITITLDHDVLADIDHIAELRSESRSAVMERILRNGIEDENKFLDQLSNPIIRELTTRLAQSPQLIEAISRVVGEQVSQDDLDRYAEAGPRLKEAGRKRQSERKAKRGKGA